ncbi:unnamed protein product [Polarella glacialis]|nr:unnamed protein product [Polarella glacialis]
MSTSSGPALRGRILDSWGQPLDGRPPPPVPADQRRTFVEFKSMQERTNQYRALFTGVQGVDFAVPIGRGQTMLFQGTNPEEDRRHLWPDLMASEPQPGCRAKGAETVGPGGWKANDPRGQTVNVAVCRTLADAEELRSKLEARGCWERCTIIVPQSDSPGAGMIALSAALSFAESFSEKDGEALVLGEFESMHRVWNALADVAGQERQAKGILVDPADSNWVDMAGTILRESIAERRKFWFNLVSRAANSVDGGSVSLLGWLWEKEGGLDFRRKQAYEKRVKQVMAIPRISDDIRQKMLDKLKDEAQSSGALVATSAAQEPDDSSPGVPNWEIEELKSITDGHILLRPHESADWRWSVDAYRSLPRLGTDALHPALISVDAPKLRLKMMQGRDRANFLQDTRGAPQTLDKKRAVQIELLELVLQQPAGRSFSVQQEVARLMIASEPDCKRLRDCEVSQRSEVLDSLTEDLLVSAPGQRAVAQILETGDISQEAYDELAKEVELR